MSFQPDYGLMLGRFPAVVQSYNQARRTCRISLAGVTDGGQTFPEAEIEYPIGDKSRSGNFETEIEIWPGDTVWVEFIGGDPRYPIITGWRNPRVGNSVDWRRWHHKNIEHLADEQIKRGAGVSITDEAGQTITRKAGTTVTETAGSKITFSVGGSSIEITPSAITFTSPQININGVIAAGGSGGGTATFSGKIIGLQDIIADGISLEHHTHDCPHGGDTSEPK